MRSHDASASTSATAATVDAARPAAELRGTAAATRSRASGDPDGDALASWRSELLGLLAPPCTGDMGRLPVDARRAFGGDSGGGDDGVRFARALDRSTTSSADTALGTAADLVGDWLASASSAEAGAGAIAQEVVDLEFSVESLSLGPLRGRVSIARGKADVELQAFRPATAAVLRSRQAQLQQMVRRDSGDDVELRIL